MSELVAEIFSALKQSQPGVPEQQVLMGTSMRILGGDWTPFDTIRPQLRAYVDKNCDGNGKDKDKLAAFAAKLADQARAALADSEAVNVVLAENLSDLKGDTDAITMTYQVLCEHLPVTLGLIVNHEDSEGTLFSTALKNAEIEMIGDLLEKIARAAPKGDEQLQQLLRAFSAKGSQEIMAKYPQHGAAAMFGLPMALNMMSQFHQEYRKRHDIPIASPLT